MPNVSLEPLQFKSLEEKETTYIIISPLSLWSQVPVNEVRALLSLSSAKKTGMDIYWRKCSGQSKGSVVI